MTSSKVGELQKFISIDISNLFIHFLNNNTSTSIPSFKQFEKYWIQQHFPYLHYCCLCKEERFIFMQLLYGTLLSYLNEDFKCTSLVIYSLFLFFKTQPTIWPIEPICICCWQWDLIIGNLKREKQQTEDVIGCFNEMVKEKAFLFVASERDIGGSKTDQINNLLLYDL